MVTVGTWNLENLFRPGEASGHPSGTAEYEAKLDSLAATITDVQPDVLAVQEVGDPEALSDLVGRLDGSWRFELADPDQRGIRVGVVSTRALTRVEQFSDFPDGLHPVQVDDDGTTIHTAGRPALRVRFRAGGRNVDVVSCHLKSKLLTFGEDRFSPSDEDQRARYAVYALCRRAAEAATVRAFATGLLDGDGHERSLIVAGDLNDTVQAATTQILLGPPGSEIGTPGHDRPDDGDGARLWNLAPLIPSDLRYSRIYRGRRELIDHLMVSHALLDVVQEVTTGDVEADSITDHPNQRRDSAGSDHRPVLAALDL